MVEYKSMNLLTGTIIKDGQTYTIYHLPLDDDLPIYRGDTRLYNDYNKPTGTPVKGQEPMVATFLKNNNFFTLFPDEAKIYGVPYRYKRTTPLELLAIDKHSENNDFYKNAPSEIKIILKNNYGWDSNKRDSNGLKDDEVARYICEDLKLDGYASEPMESVDRRLPLPSEILICNSRAKVASPVQVEDNMKKSIENYMSDYNTRLANDNRDVKTLVGPSDSQVGYNDGKNLFGFSPGSPGSPVGKNLFGSSPSPKFPANVNGGKHKTNKKRKTNKNANK